MVHKNGEGYPDPTDGTAIREADKPPERVAWFVQTMKALAEVFDMEIRNRIVVRDKQTGREYR